MRLRQRGKYDYYDDDYDDRKYTRDRYDPYYDRARIPQPAYDYDRYDPYSRNELFRPAPQADRSVLLTRIITAVLKKRILVKG